MRALLGISLFVNLIFCLRFLYYLTSKPKLFRPSYNAEVVKINNRYCIVLVNKKGKIMSFYSGTGYIVNKGSFVSDWRDALMYSGLKDKLFEEVERIKEFLNPKIDRILIDQAQTIDLEEFLKWKEINKQGLMDELMEL